MDKLTGIILAGGKSSRFKSVKYLAKLNGKNLLEIAIFKLKPFCREILVVSKEAVEINKKFKVRNIIEKDQDFHPLVGIIEGLRASSNEANLVLACDMPLVSQKMIKGLVDCKSEVCLYCYKGRPEPLLGFYQKTSLKKINHQPPTTNHKSRIIDILSKCNLEYIDIEGDCLDFININTEEDLYEAKKIIERNPKILSN